MTGSIIVVLKILLLFACFGFIHSFLASNSVKKFLIEKLDGLIAFYRLFYVIFSLLVFYWIYLLLPNSHIIIYDLPYPFDFIILIPQFLSLVGILWTLRYFSVKEFLGVNQILRWINKEYNTNELDEKLTLRIKGPYKWCRHPVYFFSIMFLAFRPEISLSYLTLLACIAAYFYAGSVYEEKKLIERFGQEYINYKNAVPRIFPYKIFYPYKPGTDNKELADEGNN